MTARNVRKNFHVLIDGRGYAGQAEEYNPPTLELSTEDFRAGGSLTASKITVGHEPLESDLTLISFDADVLASWSVVEGASLGITVREALEDNDGVVTGVVHVQRGKVLKIEQGTAKAGEPGKLKLTMNPTYYKQTHGARVVQEIDVENMKVVNNGVDVLAPMRAALGL